MCVTTGRVEAFLLHFAIKYLETFNGFNYVDLFPRFFALCLMLKPTVKHYPGTDSKSTSDAEAKSFGSD